MNGFDSDFNRINEFISFLSSDNSPVCEAAGNEARKRGVPVIRREAEGFLKMLLALKEPVNVLEIGTAVGYSTMIIAENSPENSLITTIEIGEEDAAIARRNFDTAGLSERISLIVGDAADVLPKLSDKYDFVFLDASKGQYLKFFNMVRGLLAPKAVVLTDNVLHGGDVLKSRFVIKQRDRTVHKRMRDFIFEITHDGDFVTSVVPVGDGMAVSVYQSALLWQDR